jgi:ATP-dependent exoDNAse (exonuclease V) alpha subunit
MAYYRFHISPVGRGAGRRATAAAAYRSGERLRDERSGRVYNYSHRRDVLHSEIFLPSHLDGRANAWASNRERLWNTAEHSEKRSNSRVAREYQVALPHELTAAQQVGLARALSRELADRYKVAVDLAVHLPRPDGDQRNFHAHLLTTTREITPQGLGAKAGLDMSSTERRRRELPDSRQEFNTLRERWATLTNEALREADVEARVDHRSLAARGVDREPKPSIPIAALKMEQRGVRSEVAERIREAYRQRVQIRLERAVAEAGAVPSAAAAPTQVSASSAMGAHSGTEPKDAEEVRRRARDAWLSLRTQPMKEAVTQAERPEQVQQGDDLERVTRNRDDDLTL